MYGSGAFIRHGAIPDPLELDGGERFDWMARSGKVTERSWSLTP